MDVLPNRLPPVSGDLPAGPDLREDYSPQSLYYRLRDARAEARSAERQADSWGEQPRDGEQTLRGRNEPALPERWRLVRDLAAQALAGTRDLEIGAWHVEALLRCDGLAGFAIGVDLLAAMAGEFWGSVHPLPDNDGTSARVASITGLNGQGSDGTLMQPLRKLPLFERPDGGVVAMWQYEQSEELEGIGDATRRQQRLDAGVLPFDAMEAAARAAGGEHFAVLREDAAAALAAWERLAATLDAMAGDDGPPTGRVRDVLARLHAIVGAYAGPAVPASVPEAAAPKLVDARAGPLVPTELSPAAFSAAPPRTREDALRALEEIAEFFLRTEPLSPLSYTLQDAVRRGRMTWPELLAEIVPDWTTRTTILTSLGIKPPDAE